MLTDLSAASEETGVTRGKLIKLSKPPFLHLRTGNNHTGLSRSHPRVVEGNQMRFLKSINWQRALHKSQAFLLLSVGLPLLPTDQSGPVRPALAAPASPTASPSFPSLSFGASEMLGLSTPLYISGSGSWAPLAPLGAVVSLSWRQSLPRRPPPPCAPSLGTATGQRIAQ